MKFVQIASTFANQTAAKSLATRLVQERLVACAQVEGPITSVYYWNGDLSNDSEWRLVAKTRADMFDRVAEFITDVHDYDVPQIVATELTSIAEPYRNWLVEQTEAGN